MPRIPISPARCQNLRSGRPMTSHSGYAGTTSYRTKSRTSARNASCASPNTVLRMSAEVHPVAVRGPAHEEGQLDAADRPLGDVVRVEDLELTPLVAPPRHGNHDVAVTLGRVRAAGREGGFQ